MTTTTSSAQPTPVSGEPALTASAPAPKPGAHRRALRQTLVMTAVFTLLGLAAGLFYREFTKANGFPDGSAPGQLGLVHTHVLTLGVIGLLIVLALEKSFRLSDSRLFSWFFWIYSAGIVVTGAMLAWNGMLQVTGAESSKMISGIAGTGHMLLSAGFVLLLLNLWMVIRRVED